MVHYTQCTWAMNYINACRTHMTVGQGKFRKKRCSDNLLSLSQQIHTYSLRLIPSFENHFCCYSARKDEKQALWKIKASFRILFSDTCIYVCMRSASSSEEALCFLKEAFENAFWVVALKLHHIHTRPLGMGKKLPASLVGLMGTDSLITRPRVRRETWPGYEVKALSPYEPHTKVIQYFERSIASKMCDRIIFDIWMDCHTYTCRPTCVVNAFQCIGQTILIYFSQGLCHLSPRGWPMAQVPLQPRVHHLNHALLWVGLKLAPNVIKYGGWEVQGVSEVKPHGGDIS